MTREERLAMLDEQRRIYIAYLGVRVATQDWRGVRDIAADLECLDREVYVIKREAINAGN